MLQFRNRDALSSNIVSCRPIRLKLDGCTSLESHALEGQSHCALPKVQNPGSPHLAASIPQQTNEVARIWVIGKCISHCTVQVKLHHAAVRTWNGRVELRVGRK